MLIICTWVSVRVCVRARAHVCVFDFICTKYWWRTSDYDKNKIGTTKCVRQTKLVGIKEGGWTTHCIHNVMGKTHGMQSLLLKYVRIYTCLCSSTETRSVPHVWRIKVSKISSTIAFVWQWSNWMVFRWKIKWTRLNMAWCVCVYMCFWRRVIPRRLHDLNPEHDLFYYLTISLGCSTCPLLLPRLSNSLVCVFSVKFSFSCLLLMPSLLLQRRRRCRRRCRWSKTSLYKYILAFYTLDLYTKFMCLFAFHPRLFVIWIPKCTSVLLFISLFSPVTLLLLLLMFCFAHFIRCYLSDYRLWLPATIDNGKWKQISVLLKLSLQMCVAC